jgi:hypothetical protein
MNQGAGRKGFGVELEPGKWFAGTSKGLFGLGTSSSYQKLWLPYIFVSLGFACPEVGKT